MENVAPAVDALGGAYTVGPALWLLVGITVWDTAWKAVALWRSARMKMVWWFVALLVVNSIGIFPIIFLLCTRKRYAEATKKESGGAETPQM